MFDLDNIIEKSNDVKLLANDLVSKEVYTQGCKSFDIITNLKKSLDVFESSIDVYHDPVSEQSKEIISLAYNDFYNNVKEQTQLEIKNKLYDLALYICDNYNIQISNYFYYNSIAPFAKLETFDEFLYELKDYLKISNFEDGMIESYYKDISSIKTKTTKNSITFIMFEKYWTTIGQMQSVNTFKKIIAYLNNLYPEISNNYLDYMSESRWIKDQTIEVNGKKVLKTKVFMNNNFKITFKNELDVIILNEKFNK